MSNEPSGDLLHRALTELSSRDHDYPEPVATVRRRIRRHRARARAAAALGALALLTGAALTLPRLDLGADDPATNRPTVTPTATPTATVAPAPAPRFSGPPVRRVRAVLTEAHRRVVVARPYGSGPDDWGALQGHEGASVGPAGVLADDAGRVYLVDGLNRRVHVYEAGNGRALPDLAGTLSGEGDSAALDAANGDIYVLDYGGRTIDRVTPAGHLDTIPVTLPVVAFGSLLRADDGTVEVQATDDQHGSPVEGWLRLLDHGVPVRNPVVRADQPSPSTPAVGIDGGRLVVDFGSGGVSRVDLGRHVSSVLETHVIAPGTVWAYVYVGGKPWAVRVEGARATAMPLAVNHNPYEIDERMAATSDRAYVYEGDGQGGRIVEYTFGPPLGR